MSPRTLWTLVALVLVTGAAGWYWFLGSGQDEDGGVDFTYFSEESTATVGLAGQFPPDGEMPLARPLGIDGDGSTLYVAIGDQGAIGVFTYRGSVISTVAVPVAEGSPVAYPVDVAVMSDGRVAVVDTSGSRVLVMDLEGTSGTRSRPLVEGDAAPEQPTAVTVHEGKVYVGDSGRKRIAIYEADGTPVGHLGEGLVPPLTFIGDIHVSDGRIYVSDSNAGRVVVIGEEDGGLVGTLQERLGLPRGVVTDSEGRILVAEQFDSQAIVFDATGEQVIDTVGDHRTEGLEAGGGLSSPEGLLWDPDTQRLYVTDAVQGRIKVYNVRSPES